MESGSPEGPRTEAFSRVWQGFFGRRFLLFVLIFVAEVAAFFVLTAIPFFSGEQESYTQQAKDLGPILDKSLLGQIAAIFTNNIKVGLIEVIPVLGPLFFGISLYETARVTQAIALSSPQNIPAPILVITLFLLPHSWIELPAYALATGESLLLLNSLLRWLLKDEKWRMWMELEQLVLVLLMVATMLLVGSVFEATEIVLGLGGLVMWVPFVVLVVGVVLFRRRLARVPPAPEPVSRYSPP